jgi:GT2 family glycosyltransferase
MFATISLNFQDLHWTNRLRSIFPEFFRCSHGGSGGMAQRFSTGEPADGSVSIVTVTYGDRWHLLRQVLKFAHANAKVDRIVVVDNGSRTPIQPRVERAGFHKATVIRSPRNLGSAGGFKLGLETVRKYDPVWIWLLDDDNLPGPDALDTILRSAAELDETARGKCAILAYRPEHQSDIAAGVDVRRCYPAHSSFCGFHFAEIPFKIWRRLRWARASEVPKIPARVSLPYATYSGLFFHRALLEIIGTPNEELVLYADDTEFSYRIVQSGGCIWLLTGAPMRELEPSWDSKAHASSSFERWLRRGADFHVFYGSRNRAYFDHKFWLRNTTIYRINRLTYLFVLRLFAWRYRCVERYELFRRAITLGEEGHLGLDDIYPLP